MGTNTAIAILVAAMIRLVGFGPLLLVHLHADRKSDVRC